jgi:hypothetical protein
VSENPFKFEPQNVRPEVLIASANALVERTKKMEGELLRVTADLRVATLHLQILADSIKVQQGDKHGQG